MNKRVLEYLSVIMTDTCTTCNGQGDRCICVKEATENTVIEASTTVIETYDEEAEEDRRAISEDCLIRCDACSEYACICGDYD